MVIQELFAKLGFKVDKASVAQADAALKKVTSAARGVVSAVAPLAAAIGLGGAGLGALAATAVNASMQIETLRTEFGVLLQDVAKGSALFDKVHAMAVATPFDDKTLAKSAKTLLSYGVAGEEVMGTLKMLGDVAGADNIKMQYLALVYGQVMNAGRLKGDDLRQMVNWGVNPLGEIAKKRGISYSEATDLMSARKISAAEVADAFRTMTSEGGRFFGNLEAQSKTFQGSLNRLKGTIFTFMASIGDNFTPVLQTIMNMVSNMDMTPLGDMFHTVAIWGEELRSILVGPNGMSKFPYVMASIRESLQPVVTAFKDILTTLRIIAPMVIAAFGPKIVNTVMKTYLHSLWSIRKAYRDIATSMKAMGAASKVSWAQFAKGVFGAVGIALTLLSIIKEVYDYFKSDAEKALHEQAVSTLKQQGINIDGVGYTDADTGLQYFYDEQEKARKKFDEARRKHDLAGMNRYRSDMATYKKQLDEYKDLYYDAYGIYWTPSEPAISDDLSGLRQQMDDMKDSMDENTKATKDNTRSITKISFGKSAFDTGINMKFKDTIIAAYST